MAEHTPVTGKVPSTTVYVTYTHGPGLQNAHAMPKHTRVALRNRVNDQGLWEASLVAARE